MPDSTNSEETSKPLPSGGTIKRMGIGLTVALQIFLAFALVVVINIMASRHYSRRDMTRDLKFTLTELSQNQLAQLKAPVKVVAVFARNSPVNKEVSHLLEEYELAGGDNLSVEWIDPNLNPDRAEQVKLQYRIPLLQNSLVVHSEGRTRIVGEDELYFRDPARVEENRVQAFTGESALTSAILNVTSTKSPKVYILVGKGGRADASSHIFQTIAQMGRTQNLQVEPLDLVNATGIPEDADAIILPGLRFDLSPREAGLLSVFYKTPRRSLLVLLDPEAETPTLRAMLEDQGIISTSDRVMYAESTASGPVKHLEVEARFIAGPDVTKPFPGANTILPGQTQSLRVAWDESMQEEQQTKIEPLLQAAERFWGEASFLEEIPAFGPGDAPAPVTVALSAERGYTRDTALRTESSRLMVVANAALLDPSTRTESNYDFIAVTLNWMLNRSQSVDIPPKVLQTFRVDLSSRDQTLLFWVTGIMIPLSMLLFGLFVWAARRR
jgi:hypothetical protein